MLFNLDMSARPLFFEIYRLNIVDEETELFEFMGKAVRTDADVLEILEEVTGVNFDLIRESGRGDYQWSAREFVDITPANDVQTDAVYSLSFSRSTLRQQGKTVTDDRIEDALTVMYPPAAEVVHLLFYMRRHLVIVEYNSIVMQSSSWRRAFEEMLDQAAHSLNFRSGLRLEPVPRDEEILKAFRSFERLTRMRVRLRIPNPELDRKTERLRQEMVEGAIREYTQDMRNPNGLSISENGLPYATAAMAQAGYKDGDVVLTGLRDGRRITIKTGKRAARLRFDGFRDYIRGIGANAKTIEGRRMVEAILQEVDRVAELPSPPGAEE